MKRDCICPKPIISSCNYLKGLASFSACSLPACKNSEFELAFVSRASPEASAGNLKAWRKGRRLACCDEEMEDGTC